MFNESVIKEGVLKCNAGNYFDNVMVENMWEISNLVHSRGKKMLWIPYYRDRVDEYGKNSQIPVRIGNIANKTNIFDYIILQSSYYFRATCSSANCYEHAYCKPLVDLLVECADENKCMYYEYEEILDDTGAVAGYSRKSGICEAGDSTENIKGKCTHLGVEMEIDGSITDNNSLKEYSYCCNAFKKYINAQNADDRRCVAFYAGDSNTLLNNSVVKNKVTEFFAKS